MKHIVRIKNFQYKNPWARLADAILESGKAAHDVAFLESDWAETLRAICRMDDEMHPPRAQFNGNKMIRAQGGMSGE